MDLVIWKVQKEHIRGSSNKLSKWRIVKNEDGRQKHVMKQGRVLNIVWVNYNGIKLALWNMVFEFGTTV